MVRSKRKKLFLASEIKHDYHKFLYYLALASSVSLMSPAFSQQITVDGNTQTNLNIKGNITDVTTSTIHGNNAFNSFDVFNVYTGNTVNLYVPNNCSNLINLIHNGVSRIDGILNSVQNGQVGAGHIFLANPNGIIIGTQGSINVGSLTATTPTTSFMNSFFNSPGNLNATAVNNLINGNVPISSTGLISIEGKINAVKDINLTAANIINTGSIKTNSQLNSHNSKIEDIVNVDNLEIDKDILIEDGEIVIAAANDFTNSGIVSADSNNDVNAGKIDITAGNNIKLNSGSVISAKGIGKTSNGGNIRIFADNTAELNENALIDVSAQKSGKGGFAEFSAKYAAYLNGGQIQADSANGISGSILIDPDDLTISSDFFSNGADITYTANNFRLLGKTISSQKLSSGISSGNSGNITVNAANITTDAGSKILANAINSSGTTYSSGDITLNASSSGNNASSTINIYGTAIKGKNISVNATSADSGTNSGIGLNLNESDTIWGLTGSFDKASASSTAIVNIASGSGIIADNDLTIKSIANATSDVTMRDNLGAIYWGDVSTKSKAYIDTGASVSAGNNLAVNAESTNKVSVSAIASLTGNGILAVALASSNSDTQAYIASGSNILAKNTTVYAKGTQDISTTAKNSTVFSSPSGGNTAAFGIGVGYSDIDVSTKAHIDTNITTTGSVAVKAESYNTNNMQVKAKAAGESKDNKLSAWTKGKIGKSSSIKKEDTLNDLNVSAAVAINNSNIDTDAYIADNSVVKADTINVTSSLTDKTNIIAIGRSSEGNVSIGGAVVINEQTNNTNAYIGKNATIDAKHTLNINALTKFAPLDGYFEFINDFSDFDTSKLKTDIKDKANLNNLGLDKIFNTYAQCSASGNDAGIAGAVNVSLINNTTKAYIDSGSKVNTNTAFAGSDQYINIMARNDLSTQNMAGIFDLKAILGSGSEEGGSAGGSFTGNYLNNNVYAYIAGNSTLNDTEIKAANGISIVAESAENTKTLAEAGGKGAMFAIDGSVAITDISGNTVSYIDKNVKVNSGNGLTILSTDNPDIVSAAGSIAKADTAAIGAAVSVINLDKDIKSYIGSNADINTINDILIDAGSTSDIISVAVAGAWAGGKSSNPTEKGETNGSGGTGGTQGSDGSAESNKAFGNWQGKYNNVLDELTTKINQNKSKTDNTSTASGGQNSSGSANSGKMGDTSMGISGAGAVSVNLLKNTTQSYIDSGTDSSNTTKVTSSDGNIKVTAKNTAKNINVAAGYASGKTVGAGGSATVDSFENNIDAHIGKFAKTNAKKDTEVKAGSDDDLISVALGVGGSEKVGIAGSVNLALEKNNTKAYIDENSKINENAVDSADQAVKVTTSAKTKIHSGAGGIGSGKDAGVGGTVTVGIIDNTTDSYISKKAEIDANKKIEVTAASSETIETVTVGGAKGGKAGVAAAAAINIFDNDTKAHIDGGSTDAEKTKINTKNTVKATADQSVKVSSSDTVTDKNIAGGLGIGKTAGIGAAGVIGLLNNSVQAYITGKSDIYSKGAMEVSATSKETLESVAAGLAGGQSAAVAGAATVYVFDNDTIAYLKGGTAKAGGNISILAKDDSIINNITGNAAVSGSGGIGASAAVNVFNNITNAYIGRPVDGSDTTSITNADSKGTLSVSALTTEDIFNTVAGGSVGGEVGVSGAIGLNIINNSTKAYIGQNSNINKDATYAVTGQKVNILANDKTEIENYVGQLSAGGTAGVGAAIVTNTINKNTKAFINGADVYAKDGISVSANKLNTETDPTEKINSVAAGISGGGTAGVGGSVTVNTVKNTVESYITDASTVKSDDNLTVSSYDRLLLPNIGNNGETGSNTFIIAVGGTAGVGAGVAVNSINNTVSSYIGKSVTDTSTAVGSSVNAKKALTVTAKQHEDINITVGGGAGGSLSVAATVGVNNINNTTEAYIGRGTSINNAAGYINGSSGLDGNQTVSITSADTTSINSIVGQVSIGGASFGGSVLSNYITKTTKAFVNKSASLSSTGNIKVTANESSADDPTERISAVVAGFGVGSTAAVTGSVGVNIVSNTIAAYIDDNTTTNTNGNLTVSSRDKFLMPSTGSGEIGNVIGTVAIGGVVGVGGSVGANVISNNVSAYIGKSVNDTSATVGSTVNAKGATNISATQSEEINTIVITGTGSGTVAVSGAVGIDSLSNVTKAYIGQGADVNKDSSYETDNQSVTITATDSTKIKHTPAQLAAGGFAGVGAVADIISIKNTTNSFIDGDTEVNAKKDITVQATSSEDVTSKAYSVAAGGLAGIGGAISVVTMGSALDDTSKSELKNNQSEINSKISNTNNKNYANSFINDNSSKVSNNSSINLDQNNANTTSAYIGNGTQVAKVKSSTGSVKVKANDTVNLEQLAAGGGLGGLAGIGAAVAVGNIYNTTQAYIDNAEVEAGSNIEISASSIENKAKANTYAGGLGFVGAGASVAIINSNKTTKAYIADATGDTGSSKIKKANTLSISSTNTSNVLTEAYGGGAGIAAVGAAVSKAASNDKTEAYIGKYTKIGKDSDTSKKVTNIDIDAVSNNTANAKAGVGAGGFYSAGGAVSYSYTNPIINAYINDNAQINVQNDIAINAASTVKSNSEAVGGSFGGLSIGAYTSEANAKPEINSYIGKDADIKAGNNISLGADSNSSSSDYAAKSKATAAVGALIGGTGATANSIINTKIHSYIAENTGVEAGNNINMTTNSKNYANADTNARAYGIAAAGYTESKTNISSNSSSYINGDTVSSANSKLIKANNLTLSSNVTNNTSTNSTAGSGGAIAGVFSRSNNTISNTNMSYIGDSGTSSKKRIQTTNDVVAASSTSQQYQAKNDSSTGGIIAAGGAIIDNSISSNTQSYIGQNSDVNAGKDIKLTASNSTNKPDTGYNLEAGSAGLFSGGAGESTTTISQTANAYIMGNSSKNNGSATDRKVRAANNLIISALNNINASEAARLDIDGLVPVSDVHVYLTGTNNTTAQLGTNSDVFAGYDLKANAKSNANTYAYTYTETRGAAPVASGTAVARSTNNNTVNILGNSNVLAEHDVFLDAGIDADNNTGSTVSRSSARTDAAGLWGFGSVNGRAYSTLNNAILISKDSILKAGEDINLRAMSGYSSAYGYAKAKTKTYILFGIPITIYSDGNRTSDLNVSNNITVNGSVESGLYSQRNLYINSDGVIVDRIDQNGNVVKNNISNAGETEQVYDRSASIQVELNAANTDKTTVNGSLTTVNNQITVQTTTINTLTTEINTATTEKTNNTTTIGTLQTRIDALPGEIQTTQNNITAKETTITNLNSDITTKQATINSLNTQIAAKLAKSEDVSALQTQLNTAISEKTTLVTNRDTAISDKATLVTTKTAKETELTTSTTNRDTLITRNEVLATTIDTKTTEKTTTETAKAANESLRDSYTLELADISTQVDDLTNMLSNAGTDNKFKAIKINKTEIGSGYVNIAGNLSGTGTIKAPGNNFKIEVINGSTKNLIFNELTIDKDARGDVRVNNAARSGNVGGVTVNVASGNTKSIIIHNTYDPDDPRTPLNNVASADILFDRDINNIGGLVDISNLSGSVITNGVINANDVSIFVPKGDYIHNFTTGVYNTNGVSSPSSPLLVGENIFISAQKINVNGVIQSGRADRSVTINEFNPSTDLRWNETTQTYELVPTITGSDIKAYWDPADGKIHVYRADITGGNIVLNGEIVSSGNGLIRVVSGYGHINVTNNSSKDVVINNLNADRRIDGKIIINNKPISNADAAAIVNKTKTIDQVLPDSNTVTIYKENGQIKVNGDYQQVSEAPAEGTIIDVITGILSPGAFSTKDKIKVNSSTSATYYPDKTSYLPGTAQVRRSRQVYVPRSSFVEFFDGKKYRTEYYYETVNVINPASKGIGIEFAGYNNSLINVTNNSTSNIYLAENILNNTGDVNITNSGGSVYNYTKTNPYIQANNINITANNGSIGTNDDAINTNLTNGILTAYANGLVNINELSGDLNLNKVTSATNNVILTADGSINGLGSSTYDIKGKNITLDSSSGQIGSDSNILYIDSDGDLKAEAKNDIYIQEISGDMLVDEITSTVGNVSLNARSILRNGVEDEASVEGRDVTLTANGGSIGNSSKSLNVEVNGLFTGTATNDINLRTFSGLNINDITSSNGNVNLVVDNNIWSNSASDANITAKNLNISSIDGSINDINIKLDSNGILNASANKDINISNANTVIPTSLQITDTDSETDKSIKKAQVYNMINDMNIGSIESKNGSVNLTSERSITDAKSDESFNIKAADIVLKAGAGNIGKNNDINIESTGILTAIASDTVNIKANSGNIKIHKIKATYDQDTLSNVNLVAENSILDGTLKEESNIESANINLVAGNGSIGTSSDDLNLDSQPIISATADKDINITEMTGNLNLDTVTSTNGNIKITADGDILNHKNDGTANIIANDITLISNNEAIGSTAGALNVRSYNKGLFTADAKKLIKVTATSGDLSVNYIKTTGGDLVLKMVSGYIDNGNPTDTNITAQNANIDAANILNKLKFNVASSTTLNTNQDTSITGTTGDLNATTGRDFYAETLATNNVKINSSRNTTIHDTATSGNADITSTNDINIDGSIAGIIDFMSTNADFTANFGDANLHSINTSNDTRLTIKEGSILDSNSTGNATIIANNLTMSANKGNIGTDNNVLKTDLQGGMLNSSAKDLTNITETTGDINLDLVKSNDIQLVATDGSIIDGVITGNNNFEAGNNITLKASKGSIGKSGSPVNLTIDGLLDASAKGLVNLNATNGDVKVTSAVSADDDLIMTADGSILNGRLDTGTSIEAENIDLTSRNGDIGNSNKYLTAYLRNGLLNAEADNNIYIRQNSTDDFNINRMVSKRGSIGLHIPNSGANINHISAPNDISIIVDGSHLDIVTIDPASINLSVTPSGGVLNVTDGLVSQNVNLIADNITANFTDTDISNPLTFNVSGTNLMDHASNNVTINGTSGNGLIFDTLYADNAVINSKFSNLRLDKTIINHRGEFTTDKYNVIADNDNKVLFNTDVQLYPENKPFSLVMDGTYSISTSTKVVNNSDNVIVNGVSTENTFYKSTFKSDGESQYTKSNSFKDTKRDTYAKNQRGFERWNINCKATVDSSETQMLVDIRDISTGGVSVIANKAINTGSQVNIAFKYKDLNINTKAVIVRTAYNDATKSYAMGVKFVNLDKDIAGRIPFTCMQSLQLSQKL